MTKAIVFTVSPDNNHLERALNTVISIRRCGCEIPVLMLTPNAAVTKHLGLLRDLNIENVVVTAVSPHDQWPSAKSIAPNVLKQVEQALVLDADTICLQDLTPIFDEQPDKQFVARQSSRYLHRHRGLSNDWNIFTEIRWQKFLKATGLISEVSGRAVEVERDLLRGAITPEGASEIRITDLSQAPINSGVYVLRRGASDSSLGEKLSQKQQELLLRARCGEWCFPYDGGLFTMEEHALCLAVKLLKLSEGVLPDRYHLFGWLLTDDDAEEMFERSVILHTADYLYADLFPKAIKYLGLDLADFLPAT